MNSLKKTMISFVLMLALVLSLPVYSANAQVSTSTAYETSATYMLQQAPNPTFGNEWFIIALARGGYDVPQTYFETYYQNVVKHVQQVKGNLHNRKYTEYSRVILALSAIGKDAANVGGYNLIEKLADFDQVKWQGLNGPIFALIALDTAAYELPQASTTSQEKLISTILSSQLTTGGFSLAGSVADPDMTAMALQALAPYKERADVQAVIDKSVAVLADLQGKDGGYSNSGHMNAESVAQVLTALVSLSIDPMKDARFNGIVSNLLSYYSAKDGGFKHVKSEAKANAMATEQVAYALAAYHRMQQGKPALYDMRDVKQAGTVTQQTESKVTFSDTKIHGNLAEIEQAAQRGLLKGYPDGTFKPNNQLTRVQAISIIARALQLEAKDSAPFTDISTYNIATQQEIAAVYEAGILVNSKGPLKPHEKITREQLAIMLWKAYAYETKESYNATKLAPLQDIQFLTSDAKCAITFLYDFDIASGSNGFFKPSQSTTRAQAAKMFVNFLKAVEQ